MICQMLARKSVRCRKDIMKSSDRKIAASQANGGKSGGPLDTTRTRHNATKHALCARGLTPLDDIDAYEKERRQLMQELNPVAVVQIGIVERMALISVRLVRASRLEAEYITSLLRPEKPDRENSKGDSKFEGSDVKLGISELIVLETVERLSDTFQRYYANLSNSYFRELHELERLQRMSKGEYVPAPTSSDVSIHPERRLPRTTRTAVPIESAVSPATDASSSGPVTIDAVNVSCENGSSSAETEAKAESPKNKAPVAEVDPVTNAKEMPAPWSPEPSSKPLWHKP